MTRRRSKDGRRAEAIARDLNEIGNDSDFPFRISSNGVWQSQLVVSSAGAGDNQSSLSARRRNSSGTERTARDPDP